MRCLAPLRRGEATPVTRHLKVRLVAALDTRKSTAADRHGHQLECHRDQTATSGLAVVDVVAVTARDVSENIYTHEQMEGYVCTYVPSPNWLPCRPRDVMRLPLLSKLR